MVMVSSIQLESLIQFFETCKCRSGNFRVQLLFTGSDDDSARAEKPVKEMVKRSVAPENMRIWKHGWGLEGEITSMESWGVVLSC